MLRMMLMHHFSDAGASHTAKAQLQKRSSNFARIWQIKSLNTTKNVIQFLGSFRWYRHDASCLVVCSSPQNIEAHAVTAADAGQIVLAMTLTPATREGYSGPRSLLSESARACLVAGIRIPADNFPNELACVCNSVGKSLAWRSLDVAFPSHFVMAHFWVWFTHQTKNGKKLGILPR